MAEVTGLVVGTIGLAALFQTCIELFERFELGRNQARDYQLACTKIDLLQARLSHWGEQFRVETPGLEHPALRQNWNHEQAVIARSLIGIKDIFESASTLAARYNVSPNSSRIARLRWVEKSPPKHLNFDAESRTLFTRLSRWATVGRRTIWAVRDKSRLDDFIHDLSFLIDNLDKVGARVAMNTAKDSIKRKSVPLRDSEHPDKTRQPNTTASKTSTCEPKVSKVAAPQARILTKEVIDLVGQKESQIHLNRTLKTKGGVLLVGSIGQTNTRQVTEGETIENVDGFVLLGNASGAGDLERLIVAHRSAIVSEAEASDSSTDSDSSQRTLQERSSSAGSYQKRV